VPERKLQYSAKKYDNCLRSPIDTIFLKNTLLRSQENSNNQYDKFFRIHMLNIKLLKENYLMLNFLSDGDIIVLLDHVHRASQRINMSMEEILRLIDEEIQREMPHV